MTGSWLDLETVLILTVPLGAIAALLGGLLGVFFTRMRRRWRARTLP